MSMPSWAPWVWQVLAITLAVVGAVLLCWGLWSDRSRGRRRCPKCWYDMSATAALRCPECGLAAHRERGLFKTRRIKWAVRTALMLLVAGYACRVGPRVAARGWRSLVPFRYLVTHAEGKVHIPPSDSFTTREERDRMLKKWNDEQIALAPWHQEIQARLNNHEVWSWDITWMIERFLDTVDLDAALTIRHHLAASEPVWITVDLRSDCRLWPVQLQVGVQTPGALRSESWGRRAFASAALGRYGVRGTCGCLELPRPRTEATELQFDLLIGDEASGEVYWSKRISRSVFVVPAISDLLIPVDSDPIWGEHRDQFRVRKWKRDAFAPQGPDQPQVLKFTLGLIYELYHEDELIVSIPRVVPELSDRYKLFLSDERVRALNDPRIVGKDLWDGHWKVRIRGDPSVAYRDPLAIWYWSGTCTIDLLPNGPRRPSEDSYRPGVPAEVFSK